MNNNNAILVYGPSKSGKSTAAQNLDPETTGIICSDSKALPFKGSKRNYVTVYEEREDGKRLPALARSNYIETKKPASIMKVLQAWNARPEIKTIMWDTMTHVIMYRYMTDPSLEGSGTNWDFYKILAREIYKILDYILKMQKDVIVVGHNDTKLDSSGNKIDAIKTIGRLLDEKVEIPSLFTTVLTTQIKLDPEGIQNDYFFVTQSDGSTIAGSPMGMFEKILIPNDYKYVFEKIHQYNYE